MGIVQIGFPIIRNQVNNHTKCYFSTDDENLGCILYIFCDASNVAFASVIYLVTQTKTGYHSALVTSKSSVEKSL